ncbi:glycosyltransferase (plasmid) [Tundrisphaera sp. TA3]|uniref:glycosyltransferase n=1 Tax=Tundrisphaera sp. TA3 TaxID=3435775 RepID=UPI003EC0A9C8
MITPSHSFHRSGAPDFGALAVPLPGRPRFAPAGAEAGQPSSRPSGSREAAPRIVHLGKFYHPAPGGIESAIRSLAHAQAGIGGRVRVICMDHERGRATRVERDGPVEVVRLRRASSLCKLDHCPDLRGAIRDSGADVIHLHTPNPTMILGLMLSGSRTPLVVSHHSDVVKQKVRRLLFSPIERACYDRARLILAMSPPYAAGSPVLRRYEGRVDVLPIGLDLRGLLDPPPDVRARAEALRDSARGPIWFSCGRLVYYKGFETAMHALRHVPGTWMIAGEGPLRRPLERLAAGLGLRDRVRFLGRLPGAEDLAAHYRAAEAFWFPSNARSEAFGVVQVEAMASGCPVINAAIPHSGVPWVSRHEETGLTVPVDDPAAFAAAARRILEEPGLRARLAAGARARAASRFDSGAMGIRSMHFYASILADARGEAR